jgi:hypothetical protein
MLQSASDVSRRSVRGRGGCGATDPTAPIGTVDREEATVRPTDEVPADPLEVVDDDLAPDDERPVVPPGAGGPGGDEAVPDEERPVLPDDLPGGAA